MLKMRSVLAFPWAYRLFGKLINGDGRRIYVREYIKPVAGMKVLDIGCGPADILSDLPDVDYHGIDLSAKYIKTARRNYGSRATFHVEDVAETVIREPASVDLVLGTGILHHLDDDEAIQLLKVARAALRPNGRFVAMDGCWVPGQSPLARWFLKKDRGEFIRNQEGYTGLAKQIFGRVESHIRHNLMRIPYTHHIMICSASPTNPPR